MYSQITETYRKIERASYNFCIWESDLLRYKKEEKVQQNI